MHGFVHGLTLYLPKRRQEMIETTNNEADECTAATSAEMSKHNIASRFTNSMH